MADPDAALAMLREYAKLLLEWNRGVSNLVSRHDESRLVERHLRESLYVANTMKIAEIGHIVDYGSGAGLPAIPLAIAGVGTRWTLVESRRNKTLFMRKAIEELGLKGISVMLARLEVAADSERTALTCDALTSRATAKLGPTLALASRLVRPGGRAYLWKGSSWESEIAPDADGWAGSFEREAALAISDSPNVVLVFKRV